MEVGYIFKYFWADQPQRVNCLYSAEQKKMNNKETLIQATKIYIQHMQLNIDRVW